MISVNFGYNNILYKCLYMVQVFHVLFLVSEHVTLIEKLHTSKKVFSFYCSFIDDFFKNKQYFQFLLEQYIYLFISLH